MASSPSSDSPPPLSSLATLSPPPDSGTPFAPPPEVTRPPGPPITPPATSPPSPSVSPPTPVLVPPVSSTPPETSPPPVPPPSSSSPPISPPISSPPPIGSPPPVQPPASPSPPNGSPPPALPPPPSPPPASPSPPRNPPPSSPPPASPSPPVNPPSPSTPINVPPPPSPSHNPPISSPPTPKTSPTTPIISPPPPPPKFTPPPRSPHVPPPPEGSPPAPSGVPSPPAPDSAPPPVTSPPIVRIPPPSSLSPPKTAPSPSGNKAGIDSNVGIIIGVISGIVVLGLIGLIAFFYLKRKKKSPGKNNGHLIQASAGSSTGSETQLVTEDRTTSNLGGDSNRGGGYGYSRPWFTYRELDEATGGFSDENLLGEGGFGRVYKGRLVDNKLVAVKQLTIGGGQGEREFQAEVEIISRIHHRHLVSLVGYCISESKRLLVYDFVPNNTLHFHLHGKDRPVMDWNTRVKIAVGAARGIAYLHEDCHPRVIHRDIKAANILLDNNYEAKVSDFGLAKLATEGDTHVSTRVMGTFGYMAPEYARTGKLTDKSDVFSFGVVLLELITGRKPVDSSQSLEDESLVQWARPLLSQALDTREFDGLVDPRLEKNYVEIEMLRMIDAAAACVRHSSSNRPRMGQVFRALGEYDSRDLTNGLKVGESQVYNSAQQSAEIRCFRRMAFGSRGDTSSDAFSQQTQSSGISTYSSRPDAYFSAQPVQGGPFSQESQNPLLSGQHEINVDFSDVGVSRQSNQTAYHSTDQGGHSRQLSQEPRNPSISGQSEINVNIPDENKPDVHNSAYHSTNQGSDNV